MPDLKNLLAELPADRSQEHVQAILSAPGVRVERIVSFGQCSPDGFWYDQSVDEWVLLLAGAARLRFEGDEPFELTPGACVAIPAHSRHRVEWTDPERATIWLAIHYDAK